MAVESSVFQGKLRSVHSIVAGVLMNARCTDESLTWRTLCRAAVLEQDPGKLPQIVQRINLSLKMRRRVLRSFAEARRDRSRHTLLRGQTGQHERDRP
jgi:hypothetical protein